MARGRSRGAVAALTGCVEAWAARSRTLGWDNGMYTNYGMSRCNDISDRLCAAHFLVESIMKSASLTLLALLLGVVATTQDACAEADPSRPIKLVVSYGPGGAGDVIARIVSAQLTA